MNAIKVKATQTGYYMHIRQPGTVFMIGSIKDFGLSWMELVDEKDQKALDTEMKRRKQVLAKNYIDPLPVRQAEARSRKTQARRPKAVESLDDLGL